MINYSILQRDHELYSSEKEIIVRIDESEFKGTIIRLSDFKIADEEKGVLEYDCSILQCFVNDELIDDITEEKYAVENNNILIMSKEISTDLLVNVFKEAIKYE